MNLQFVLDKLAIQEINANYFWAVDSGDTERSRFDQMKQGMSKNKRHVPGNFIINIEGDKAFQKCYLVVYERETAPMVVSTAIYHDELVRTVEGWKFSKRSITIDPSWKPAK